MIAVSWFKPDPGGAPTGEIKRGIVVGWVFDNLRGKTLAVVMTDKRFLNVERSRLTFEDWRD